jgi:hypothetical protein
MRNIFHRRAAEVAKETQSVSKAECKMATTHPAEPEFLGIFSATLGGLCGFAVNPIFFDALAMGENPPRRWGFSGNFSNSERNPDISSVEPKS